MKISKVKITPAIAVKWLEGNTHNRRISQRTVMEYAEQMKAGLWKLNNASIAFDTTDTLADGQHRLWACIEAATPFTSLVVEGLAPEVFPTIDTGHKRTHADVIHIAKVSSKNERTIAATANLVIRYEHGTVYLQERIPPQVTLDYVKANPDIMDWVTMAMVKKSWVRAYATSIAAVAYLGARRYQPKAQQFVEAFVTGENLVAGSPILALRNRLATDKRLPFVERTAIVVLAWNAFIQGRNLSKMQTARAEKFPTIKGA